MECVRYCGICTYFELKECANVSKTRVISGLCPELYFSFLFVFGWCFFQRDDASFMMGSLGVAFNRSIWDKIWIS
jgi:hypothetical protein